MTDLDQIRRRDVLAGLSTIGSLGIAGCAGGNNSGDEDSTDTPTETEYDPQEYYGLPECDGSRPIRLIAVNSDGTGIIQNMRGQDQLVYVKHNDGFTSGDYCGGTIVEGGEQTAYEADSGEPSQIEIGAVEATGRNKDKACSQSGALPDGDYSDGCVDPNTFRGFQDVSSEQSGDNENEVWEDALEAEEGDSEDEGTPEETPEGTPEEPIEFTDIRAELNDAHSPIPPVVEWAGGVSNNRNESVEIQYEFVVENSDITVRDERTRAIDAGDSEGIYDVPMTLDEWAENSDSDSRDEQAKEYRGRFESSNVFIEYNGKKWNAEKSIDERTSYP
ncbi:MULTISPECIES: hypothetical protein [Haloarcula]|uniref:hypothetical protein n=1 Tax=Haloarcula TaxID=2237 RepID=UPI0023E7C8B1|nr:hypothetical protein [Halomicroarcula sp. SHR3]